MRHRTAIGIEAFYLSMGPVIALLAALSVGNWVLMGAGACLLACVGWMALATRYVIDGDHLDARMGPFRRRIRLRDITAVQCGPCWKGRTLGFGSDFVGIRYDGKAINVSPRDVNGFVATLRDAIGVTSGQAASGAAGGAA